MCSQRIDLLTTQRLQVSNICSSNRFDSSSPSPFRFGHSILQNDQTENTGCRRCRNQLAEPVDQETLRFQRTQKGSTDRYGRIKCATRD